MFSRVKLGPGAGGGGISESARGRFKLDVASKAGLVVGRLEEARVAFVAGVADAALDSPVVIRMNSHKIPSSVYVSCIGFVGCEYIALTLVLVIPA